MVSGCSCVLMATPDEMLKFTPRSKVLHAFPINGHSAINAQKVDPTSKGS